jgi:hypothetical protein
MKLEIKDKIQRYEFDKPVGSFYVVEKVTKTLAKSDGATFFREIKEDKSVERKDDFWSFHKKYVVVNDSL